MKKLLRNGMPRKSIYYRIKAIIDSSRNNIARVVDFEMIKAYWLIGKEIILEEQNGLSRAEYGGKTIEKLSSKLSVEYGAGWSASHLWHIRQFYLFYRNRSIGIPPHRIQHFVKEQFCTRCAQN